MVWILLSAVGLLFVAGVVFSEQATEFGVTGKAAHGHAAFGAVIFMALMALVALGALAFMLI